MKRIGTIGTVGALAVAMLVPAAVSAGEVAAPPWTVQLQKAKCTNRGGKFGFGKVVIQMRAFAHNDDPAAPTPNYIIISDRVEQKINGVWEMLGGGASATTQVFPDGTTGTFTDLLGQSLSFTSADHPLRRMVMRVEFYDDLPSGDVRLFKVSARTAAC